MASARKLVENERDYPIGGPSKGSLQLQQEFRETLTQAALIYGVSREGGRLAPALDAGINLMLQLELAPGFAARRERSLMALAIGESLSTVTSDAEALGLANCLKVVATGYRPDGEYGTLSGAVEKWSAKEAQQGVLFDPKALKPNYLLVNSDILTYAADNIDPRATEATTEQFSRWGAGSRLHVVRSILGVTPADEKPFEVIVLRKSREDLFKKFFFPSVHIRQKGKGTIILGNNHTFGEDEHEYGHSQTKFPFHLLGNGVLFKGFYEAVAELSVTMPRMYKPQCDATIAIGEQIADFDPITIRFVKDLPGGRGDFFRMMIRERGLAGLLKLARMSPFAEINPPPIDNLRRIAPHVLLPPSAVAA